MASRDEPSSVLVRYVQSPDARYPLTDEQLRTVAVIEDEATRLGYDLDVIAAMVVNAYAESTLNAKKHLVATLSDGRKIDAAGIFQITEDSKAFHCLPKSSDWSATRQAFESVAGGSLRCLPD